MCVIHDSPLHAQRAERICFPELHRGTISDLVKLSRARRKALSLQTDRKSSSASAHHLIFIHLLKWYLTCATCSLLMPARSVSPMRRIWSPLRRRLSCRSTFQQKKKKNILGGYTMSHFCTSDSISSVVGAMIGVFCRARFAVLTDFHSKLIKTCQQFCVCWTEMTVSDDLSTCSNARQCSLWVTTLFGQLSFGCAIDWWARLPARQLHREGWSWPWLPCSGLLWYQNRALSHRWSALSSPHDASNMAEVRTTEGGRQKRRRERKIYCYWAVK